MSRTHPETRAISCACVTAGILLAACAFDPHAAKRMRASAPPQPAACSTGWFQTSNIDPCEPGLPPSGGVLHLDAPVHEFETASSTIASSDSIVHTLSSTIVRTGGVRVRLVVVDEFTLAADAELDIRGPYPLLMVVHGSVEVNGTILARSGCATSSRADGGSAFGGAESTAGGGGGGGYGGAGGSGSRAEPDFGQGLRVNGTSSLEPLRGGCNGGKGGAAFLSEGLIARGGAGGIGGGGLQLSARDRLIIRGRVLASGHGGQGGSASTRRDGPTGGGGGGAGGGGGGGGGSGGALLFEANGVAIEASALVCANGGSGGDGSDGRGAGSSGADGICTRPATTPRSTASVAPGGDGGFGAIADGQNGGAASNGSGGGGGGGGVGRIRIRSISPMYVDPFAVISPAPN